MGGNPDGSSKKVKMDLSAMLVAIGNHGSRVNGMNAQTFLVNLMKPLIHLKGHKCKFRCVLFSGKLYSYILNFVTCTNFSNIPLEL